MGLDRTPVTVLFLVAALAAAQLVHYYPKLPETLAVHFAASGEPNGWSGRTSFVILFACTEAFFVLFGLAMARFLDRIPVALLNVPNKDYWFAPERRAQSAEFLSNQILWIETATLAFFVAVAQQIVGANLGEGAPSLPTDFWVVVVAFVVVVVAFSLRVVVRFARPVSPLL